MVSRRLFLQGLGLAGIAMYSREEVVSFANTRKILDEFEYGEVDLAPGRAQTQFEQAQSLLLEINEDALLKPWRLRAGLPAPGPDMGGWYDEVPPAKTASGGQGFAPANFFGQWVAHAGKARAAP
jgi:hypothetical protein